MTDQMQVYTPDTLAQPGAPPLRWLWDGYLATGMITLFTSRWKAGKTTLTSVLLAKLGTGGTLAGSSVLPARATVFTEEPPSLWHARHQQLQFPASTRFACRPFSGRPTPRQWAGLLAALAQAQPGQLVIFDPLAMFLPAHAENNPSLLLDALEPLHRVTAAGAAVLLVHHPKKGGTADELSPRGCGALAGFADILVDLDRPDGGGASDRRRRLKTASRLTASTARMIELTADGRDYALLPEIADAAGFDAGWPVLKMVLEDAVSRPTRGHLLKCWPEDFEKPSKNTLIRWLDRAQRDGLLDRQGTGRHHDAYRYSLPGQTFALDDMPGLDPLREP